MKERIVYVDNLRVALTALVVAHHAGQAGYGFGAAWPVDDPGGLRLMHTFLSINAAFFMGLFFFISGVFVEPSYARKGWRRFLGERLRRLGIPLVVFALVLVVPVVYLPVRDETTFWEHYREYLGGWQIELGPLWFLTHLLVYAVLYVVWRRFNRPTPPRRWPWPTRSGSRETRAGRGATSIARATSSAARRPLSYSASKH